VLALRLRWTTRNKWLKQCFELLFFETWFKIYR
jgi:hypothetical protein